MVEIAPFQGLRFDLDRLGMSGSDASALIAPPYDVISPDERTALGARHARNIVSGLPAPVLAALREQAAPFFTLSEGTETTSVAIEVRLAREGATRVTFAVREAGQAGTLWLGLRPDADLSSLGPPALRGLDVTVLHGLILGPLLGIDAAAMARQSFLTYTHDTHQAVTCIDAGQVQAGFFMNATKVNQVLEVCEAGFVLPQKSTYFHPKLATGVVMALIEPHKKPALPGGS